ncbi:hypothetical protein CPB84DRAFT_1793716, partial [Gymnopilus junonius]
WKDRLSLGGVLYLGLALRGLAPSSVIPKRLLSSKISIICILAGAYQYPEVAVQLPLGYYYGSNDYEPPVHFADEMDENPVYGSENCRQQTHTFTSMLLKMRGHATPVNHLQPLKFFKFLQLDVIRNEC